MFPAGVALIGFGVLIVGGLAYNGHRYLTLGRRYPERSPREVTGGNAASVSGTITRRSPTVQSPFGEVESVVAFWLVEEYIRGGSGGGHWSDRLDWKERCHGFEVDVDGDAMTVETSDEITTLDDHVGQELDSYEDLTEVVERDESLPGHVREFLREFERAHEGGSYDGILDLDVSKRVEKVLDSEGQIRYSY